MKVCIVSSCGGHLAEILAIKDAYDKYEHFYIINKPITLPQSFGRVYFITHAERGIGLLWNLIEAARIMAQEKPTVILSTGASCAVPVGIIGKLTGVPVIFIETFTRVTSPSLTGRIMYWMADRFYYQWPQLQRYFPKGIYGGTVV